MRTHLLAALLLAPSLALADAAPIKVAVLPLAAGAGIDGPTAATLGDALLSEIRRLPGVTCVTSQELNAVLTLEQQRQAIGCTGANCSIDLGRTLGVEQLVFGSIGKLGETWIFSLRLVDAKTGEAVKQSDARQRGKAIDDLLEALPGVAAELFGRMATTPGNIAKGNSEAPAIAPGKPSAEDVPSTLEKEERARLEVLTDGKGGYIVFDPKRGLSDRFWAGDANGLWAQKVYGAGRNGEDWSATFWEPRVKSGWQSSFEKKDGAYKLQCGDNSIAFKTVAKADAEKFLASAKLYDFRWRKRAFAIARDDEGTWYYVDRTREGNAFEASDYRLFVGSKNKLKPLEVEDYIGDEGGQLWITPSGKLKIDASKQSAEWIERSVRTKLVYLDIEDQAAFAYGALGVYKAERLGTACDGRL